MKIKVSSKGQIAIPKKIRDKMSINEDTVLYIVEKGDQIVLEKVPNFRDFAGKFGDGKKHTDKEHKKAIEEGYIEAYLKSIEDKDDTD